MDIDIIVISSYTHRKKIREELEGYKKDFVILDLYDELKKAGLDVNAPFYRNAADTYENVIFYRNEYFVANNAINLKNLIVAYLEIYDFINFEKFAMEYVASKYQDYQNIQKAIDEIMLLMDCIKREIKKRTYRDIIILWNDQLDYNYLQYTPYMQEESKTSMFFENAYTMTPFTVPTFLEMFQGLICIEDEIYYRPFPAINSSNSKVIEDLELSGYIFLYIGDEADASLFEKKYSVPHYTYNSSCIRCIDLLQKLLDTDKPVCILLHALEETHNPYLSGELDCARDYEWSTFEGVSEEIAMEQRKKSAKYWDKQLEFYMGFMPDGCVKIFMSDHGARYNFQPLYKRTNYSYCIFYYWYRCTSMFSIYDFNKVIGCILSKSYNEDEIFSDYILMQGVNIFNSVIISYYLENDAEESSYGFRAIRTENELYVKLSSGKIYYYLLPDEEKNCIVHADKERIKWLDGLVGDRFDGLGEHEKAIEDFRKQFETHE